MKNVFILAKAMILVAVFAGLSAIVSKSAAAHRYFESETVLTSPMPALDGDKAKDYLEKHGLSESLGEAIKRARYGVHWVEQAPVSDQSGAYEAKNPEQNFAAYFSDDGAQLVSREAGEQWNFSLKLSRYGNGEQSLTVDGSRRWSADKAKVSVSHEIVSQITQQKSQIIEWFENKPNGLEQSFIVQEKLDHQPIKLVMSIQGDLVPEVSADGQAVMLTKHGSGTVLRYDRLKSWDANGTELMSRMEVHDSGLSLIVDDANAVYPVTIDPTFTQVKKLLASDGATGDFFGSAVALSGDVAIVGAFGDNGLQGAAYLFQRNTGGVNNWSEIKKLTASDGGANDSFGSAVAIRGDTVVIGAGGDVAGGQGSAYIFERNAGGANNWGEIKKLSPTDGVYFGTSVSIDKGLVVVGAEGFFDGETGAQGAAYIFEQNRGGVDNWGLVKKIQADDGVIGDFFGKASCIKGDTVFVGNGFNGAYVFERHDGGIDNWGQLKKMLSVHGVEDTGFGFSISIDGDKAVIGAVRDFEGDNDDGQGAAYIYGRNLGGENNWGLIKRIIASDGAPADFFGASVAVSGDRIIVGAFGDDIGANINQGSAYVFEQNSGGADNWGQVNKIVASGGVAQDQFGVSIALNGNTAIAGAPGANLNSNTNRGSAFVFVRANESWTQEAKPLPANCTVEEYFGSAVAISGDTAIVGSTGDDVGVNANQGAAYIFERNVGGTNNWGLVDTITASDGSANDFFGSKLAINGNTAIVGVVSDAIGTNAFQGSAYIFERNFGGTNNWGEVKKLTASDAAAQDWFGWSVGISGDTAIVGALLKDVGPSNARGSAYVFERNSGGANNWGEVKKLTASDGATGDTFGSSVAIGGNTAVVGAFLDDIGAIANQGSVYVFERNNGGANNWGELRKVTASDGSALDQFGTSVAISGNLMVVGAFVDDVGTNNNQGSAYIYERNTGGAENWGQVKKLIAADGSAADYFGASVAIDADTVIVSTNNDQIGANPYQGSAYIFKQNAGGTNNWGQVRKIVASDGAASDYFGTSVAISGDTAIIGAFGDDVGGASDQGSARIVVSGGGTWDQQALLAPPPPTNCGTDDNFGFAVAISGDTAVISATADDVGINTNQGSVYVLERNFGGAGNWGLLKILAASDAASNEAFGNSVAIDGDTVIVGVANKTVGTNTGQGAAYIFKRNNGGPNNFGEVKKIVASDGAALDTFGWSVGVSGDTVVVGAYYGANVRPGAAYIFKQNSGGPDNWGQIKKLSASDGTIGNWFGWSASISGDTVIVSAPSDNVGANNAQGSAYIFERNTGGSNNWGELKKITASDGALGDQFGTSVSIEGSTTIVGAKTDDIATNPDQGSAYIFERNTGGANNWGQIKKLVDLTGETFGYFGTSVSISGDAVIVGSPFDNIGPNAQQGSAFIFSQNAGGADYWGQVQKLVATDGAAGDALGWSVAVSGDNFLVGAYQANVPTPFSEKNLIGGNQQGASYVFRGSDLAPTAAEVSISGRVLTANDQGIRGARVTLTAPDGARRTAITSTFGSYTFDDVDVGHTYVLEIASKRYTFANPTRVVSLQDTLTGMDFIAEPQ